MTLAFNWGTVGSLGTNRVRLGRIDGLSLAADRGTVSSCRLIVEDIPGNLVLPGLGAVYVTESDATADPRVWQGYAAERDLARNIADAAITGASREWDGSLVDMNAAFGFLVARGADAKRPAETVNARIAWCIGEFGASFPDEGQVMSSSLMLSAADYTGMYPSDILNDCGELTGFNYFRYYDQTANHAALAFFPDTYTGFDSTFQLSNVLADIDDSTTFGAIASLNRDPSDRFTGVLVIWNGGQTFVGDSPRVSSSRETSVSKDTITSAAHATAFANRYLAEHATDLDEITAVVEVPKANVNDAMPGQRIQVKFSHLDGYEDWTYIRIAQRSVAQDKETQDRYTITFTLRNPRSTGGSGGGPGGGGGSVGNPGPPSPSLPPFVPCETPDPHYYSFELTTDDATDHAGIADHPGMLVAGTTYNYSITASRLQDPGQEVRGGISSVEYIAATWNIGSNPLTINFDLALTYTGSFTQAASGLHYGHGDSVYDGVVFSGWVDPVDWIAPTAEDCAPLSGQVVVSTNGAPELIGIADGDTTGQTNWPYALGGLHIFVSGYGEVIVDQTDPATGEFELPFPKPDGAQVYGWYLAGSGPATGATNGPAISELDYIPPELLGSGSDRSGDNVLHDDWTWGPAVDASDFETKTAGGGDVVDLHGSTGVGSTETIAPANGNVHKLILNVNCTLTLTAPTSGPMCTLEVYLIQDATGSRTATWPGSVVWPGGTAPTLSTAANAVDRFVLETSDGGTTWYGTQVGGGGSALTIKDEGGALATAATSIDFVGPLVTASGTGAAKTVTVTGALDDLTDVTITSPTTADRLRYSGSAWVNSALIWRPLTTYDPTSGLWVPLVDGDGNAIMVEA